MRGSRPLHECAHARLGIIPAGAGLTFLRWLRPVRARDHPRGCGAHCAAKSRKSELSGSSPRVRGSQAARAHGREPKGIIPAGAGLTTGSIFQMRKCRDHPRGCGAHDNLAHFTTCQSGSSPRVRGSPSLSHSPLHPAGIIPAGAGLTLSKCRQDHKHRDHPRGCGAHILSRRKPTPAEGIIPAGAGLTGTSGPCAVLRRDHPRGCGAHA